MADFDDYFRAALIDAVRTRGSQARLARASGINTSYINNIVKGRDSGSESTRRALAGALGFSGRRYEDFLEVGRAILEGRDPPAPAPPSAENEALADFFRVPLSAAIGLNPEGGGPTPPDWGLDDSPVMVHGPTLGRTSPWGLRAFGVEDGAMEPLIAKGGLIVADLMWNDYRTMENGEIYVIGADVGAARGLVRQVEWAGRERDRLAFKAHNPVFPTLYRLPREIVVVGRVIWAGRRFE